MISADGIGALLQFDQLHWGGSASATCTRTVPTLLRPWQERSAFPFYGSNPYTVSWLIEATKTFPLTTSGTLNLAAKSSVSREPA